ncbi:MAG: hypothetical protein RLZZ550_1698 [Verrucomicrobiota bacterium]|jgi:hypothetical protein
MVYHYGTFVFKPEVTPATIDRCFAEMRGMVGKIPGLLSMQHGVYQSDEGLNDGFTHGFVMTFDSPKSRDEYLPHPEHERVKLVVVPNLARVMVFDFTV